MADILFFNNASSLLDLSINASVLTIQVASGDGPKFPSPSPPQYFVACLEDDSGNVEYVKIESRSGDVLTVEAGGRGFDNSSAQSFTQNVTRVELRLSAHVVGVFLQTIGDSMTGDLNMLTNEIQNAELTGTTIITGGQTVGTAIRGVLDQASNEIAVPPSGPATSGGAAILASGDDLIVELDTGGIIDFTSATIRVIVGNVTGASLRIASAAGTEFLDLSCDGTDILAAMTGITELKFTGANLNIDGDIILGGNDLLMGDGLLSRANLRDFSLDGQLVTAIAVTDIDYELGNYVELDFSTTIVNLNIINPPATSRYGTIRIKMTQGSSGGPYLVTNWPSGTKWPNGAPPSLSVNASAIDFVELWTDDFGTTWYGDYGFDWS